MKIETKKERVEQAVSKAAKITSKNSSLPVLNCLLLEVSKNSLFIRSTNLELGVEFEIPVKVEQEGSAAVPADILSSFINNLPKEEQMVLFLKDDVFNIKTNSNETSIKTYDKTEFPTLPQVSSQKTISLPIKTLIDGFRSVWFASSPSHIKPELASVCVFSQDDNLYFAATDSFRLAEKKVKNKNKQGLEPVLVPYKNIPEIIRILEDKDQSNDHDLELKVDKNQLSIVGEGVYITSRLIEGSFPDYSQIIPQDFVTEVVVLKEDLLNALKISNVFTDEFKKLEFNISPQNKKVQIQTQNVHIGENTTSLNGSMEGGELKVSFNYKYIVDVFQSILTDSVSLKFAGEGKPLVVQGVSDNTFLYLVMPMNK